MCACVRACVRACVCVCFALAGMKGLSSKRIALKVDVIGPEYILFARASVRLSAWKFTGWGSEGVN